MCGTRISNLLGKITILLIICCCGMVAQGKYGGGSGEPNDPYLIFDANHMQAIGADANDWDKHFKLKADIDLSPFDGNDGRPEFNMIGEYYYAGAWVENPFTGVFDGNGHTISNFTYISSPDSDGVGLFGYTDGENCLLKDLGIIDGYIEGDMSVGLLVGCNEGTIINCYSTGSVVGTGYTIGGLIGCNGFVSEATIIDCYSTASLSGVVNQVGGLVGANIGGNVWNSYATGMVSGNSEVGGLVGSNQGGSLSHCYATGSVSGLGSGVGGLVGKKYQGSISNCYWDIETSGIEEPGEGEGKTTAEMYQQSTFTNWDFLNIWNIGENQTYPYLRTVLPSDLNKDRITNFLDIAIICEEWLIEE